MSKSSQLLQQLGNHGLTDTHEFMVTGVKQMLTQFQTKARYPVPLQDLKMLAPMLNKYPDELMFTMHPSKDGYCIMYLLTMDPLKDNTFVTAINKYTDVL